MRSMLAEKKRGSVGEGDVEEHGNVKESWRMKRRRQRRMRRMKTKRRKRERDGEVGLLS